MKLFHERAPALEMVSTTAVTVDAALAPLCISNMVRYRWVDFVVDLMKRDAKPYPIVSNCASRTLILFDYAPLFRLSMCCLSRRPTLCDHT